MALHIHELPLPSAVQFLLKRASQHDAKAAESIALRLGCLPLALEQAAAYVQSCQSTLERYGALLEQHGLELLNRGQAYQYAKTIGTTWSLAFNQLQLSCPASVDLMHLCAFFAPEDIHIRDLANAKEHLPQRLAEALGDELKLDEVRAALLKYSLIRTDGDAISIHRLVQEAMRQRLSNEEREGWLTAALRAVNALFPDDSNDVRNWPACATWLPHALVLVNWDRAEWVDAKACAHLLSSVAVYELKHVRYATAEPLFRRALEISARHLGENHPDVARDINNLAVLLEETDRIVEAERLCRRALEIVEQRFGPNHPDVAVCVNNLAALLKKSNRVNEAEPLFRRALEIDEQNYGPNHRIVAERLNNLAAVLEARNRRAEAEPLYRQALEMWQKNLDPEHPQVALALNNLALLLEDTGRRREAESLFRRALEIDEASYGPNHPTVAKDLMNLGCLLRNTNRPLEAEPLLHRALTIFESSLGPDHPDTERCRAQLGSLLQKDSHGA